MTFQSAATRIYIKLEGYTKRGPVYQARLGAPDGSIIVNSSLEPLLAACRVLVARGCEGRIEMWDLGRPFARLAGDMAYLAKLTVREDETTSPTLCLWRPFPVARGGEKTAIRVRELPNHPKTTSAKIRAHRATAKSNR